MPRLSPFFHHFLHALSPYVPTRLVKPRHPNAHAHTHWTAGRSTCGSYGAPRWRPGPCHQPLYPPFRHDVPARGTITRKRNSHAFSLPNQPSITHYCIPPTRLPTFTVLLTTSLGRLSHHALSPILLNIESFIHVFYMRCFNCSTLCSSLKVFRDSAFCGTPTSFCSFYRPPVAFHFPRRT